MQNYIISSGYSEVGQRAQLILNASCICRLSKYRNASTIALRETQRKQQQHHVRHILDKHTWMYAMRCDVMCGCVVVKRFHVATVIRLVLRSYNICEHVIVSLPSSRFYMITFILELELNRRSHWDCRCFSSSSIDAMPIGKCDS